MMVTLFEFDASPECALAPVASPVDAFWMLVCSIAMPFRAAVAGGTLTDATVAGGAVGRGGVVGAGPVAGGASVPRAPVVGALLSGGVLASSASEPTDEAAGDVVAAVMAAGGAVVAAGGIGTRVSCRRAR